MTNNHDIAQQYKDFIFGINFYYYFKSFFMIQIVKVLINNKRRFSAYSSILWPPRLIQNLYKIQLFPRRASTNAKLLFDTFLSRNYTVLFYTSLVLSYSYRFLLVLFILNDFSFYSYLIK